MLKRKKTLTQRILKYFFLLLILSIMGGGGYWYYLKLQTIQVKTKKITRGLFLYTVTSTSSGTLKADRVAKISSRINGRVVRVNFSQGDRVQEGERLIALEPEEALANTKMAEANLSLAKVKYEQAKVAYELEKKLVHSRTMETEANLKEAASTLQRAKDMMRQKIYSDQQMDSAVRNYDVAKATHNFAMVNREGAVLKEKEMLAAEAEVKQFQEALRIAEIRQNYLTIKAPFQGIISLKDVEVGEMVLPGVSLAEIVDDHSIYVRAPIDEADIHKIHIDQEVRITIDAFPHVKFTGILYEISPIVSEEKQEGRTVTVKISIDPNKQTLRTGMSCDIDILVDKKPGALLVPTNLLMGRGNKKHVFSVDKGIVKKRPVRLGLSNWNYTVVVDGLREGEKIISSIDILNLKEGSRVEIRNEQK